MSELTVLKEAHTIIYGDRNLSREFEYLECSLILMMFLNHLLPTLNSSN